MHAHCLPNTRTEVEETKRLKDEHNMNKASSCQHDPTRAFPGCSSRCIKLWERMILARSRCNNCCWSTPLLCSCGSQASKCFTEVFCKKYQLSFGTSLQVLRRDLFRPSEAPWLFDAPRLWPWWSAGLLPLASETQLKCHAASHPLQALQGSGRWSQGQSRTVGWCGQWLQRLVPCWVDVEGFFPSSITQGLPRCSSSSINSPTRLNAVMCHKRHDTKNNPVNNRMDVHFSSKHKLKNVSPNDNPSWDFVGPFI